MNLSLPGLLWPWNFFPNTILEVGWHFLLQVPIPQIKLAGRPDSLLLNCQGSRPLPTIIMSNFPAKYLYQSGLISSVSTTFWTHYLCQSCIGQVYVGRDVGLHALFGYAILPSSVHFHQPENSQPHTIGMFMEASSCEYDQLLISNLPLSPL